MVVRAWANRQVLARAERLGWKIEPTHLSFTFTVGTAPLIFRTLAFGDGGPVPLLPDDVPLSEPMAIRGLPFLVLRHFLEDREGEAITLHFEPSTSSVLSRYLGDSSYPDELEVVVVALGGYTEVRIGANGVVSVKGSFGEVLLWDGWATSPGGGTRCVDPMDAPCRLPGWLNRAIEEAKARAV